MTPSKHAVSRIANLGARYSLRTSPNLSKPTAISALRSTTSCKSLAYRVDFSTTSIRSISKKDQPDTMATDDDYMSFLNKANEDASGGQAAAAQSQGQRQFKAQDSGSEIPKAILSVCQDTVYESDADEPFEAVSLKWNGEGGLPDEVEFAKLINHWDAHNADITIMDPTDWDTRGKYTKVLDAVRDASKGNDVRVYQVTKDHSRVEYWLVSRAGDRIVGAKALSVES